MLLYLEYIKIYSRQVYKDINSVFKELTKAKWHHQSRALIGTGQVSSQEEEETPQISLWLITHTEEGPCEDTAGGGHPRARQEERPQQKPARLAPRSSTSSLRNFQKMRFCCSATQSAVFCYGSSRGQTPTPTARAWRRTRVLRGRKQNGQRAVVTQHCNLAERNRLLCDVGYFCPFDSVLEIVDSDKIIGSSA